MAETNDNLASVPVMQPAAEENKIDLINDFNDQAPRLFTKRLSELGYLFCGVWCSAARDTLWSSTLNYENDEIGCHLSIQQAPYYSDYGFSVFLYKDGVNDGQLLCHVERSVQDLHEHFLEKIATQFFADEQVQGRLRGHDWEKAFNPIGL